MQKPLKRSATVLLTNIAITLVLLASLPGQLVYAMRPVAYTDYSFAMPGPFYNFDIYITWESAPVGEAYIYPAFQFLFQANQGGYIGIQMVGNTKKAIFSIWDVDSNPGSAQPAWPSCGRFDWEGNGTWCIIDYNWVEGREYRLRLWAYGPQADGESWIGAIYDTVTQQETTIGVIQLKNSNGYAGYGWLRPDAHTFFEYFGGADACENQPYARVLWRGPFANAGSVFQGRAVVPAHVCDSTNVATRGYLTAVHEAGGNTQRTTPDGTVLWDWAWLVYKAYLPIVLR
jgi:hypothetical protein